MTWDVRYCDFCRSNLWENDGHQDWCPVLEVQRLREALREVRDTDADLPDPSTPWSLIRKLKSIAREALNETSVRHRD